MAEVTVMFGGAQVSQHRIAHNPFVVGRDGSCDVSIDNVGVSRNHCQFTHDGKRWYVEDMGSANGTYHRGQKIRKAPIGDGDQVQIGKHTLVFKRGAPNELAPPPKGGVAAAAAAGGPGPAAATGATEKDIVSDGMMTFKMDARLIHQQMGAKASTGPQRAAQVASAFGGPSAKKAGGSVLWRLFKGLIVLAALGGAVLYLLKTLKIVQF
jgi:predicted component of type VI protein secretion system